MLRNILLDAISADTIKWGYALKSTRGLGRGEHEPTFTNGTTAVVNILIGADGGNSRIRRLVSPAVPIYHSVTRANPILRRKA